MRRYLSILLLTIGLGTYCLADEPSSTSPDLARVWQVRRNQSLVKELVGGGVQLAQAEGYLDRARFCNELARNLAEEIRQAGDDRDGDRAVELSRHLQNIVENGVATNLNRERAQVPRGSTREREMNAVRDKTGTIIEPLLDDLDQILKDNPAALKEVLRAIQEAHAAVAAAGKAR